MEILYENIKKYRKRLNMTQQQLADLTGYGDRSSIAKIEKGLVDIPQSKLELFADVLNVSPGKLMDDPSNDPHLTPRETTLLGKYRQLNEEGQEKLEEYADDLVTTGKYKKCDSVSVDSEAI